MILFVSNAVLAAEPGAARMLFCLQALFYLSAVLATWLPVGRWSKPLTIPLYFCTLNAAAFMSVIGVVRGRRYVVWETVRR
jgi:hypothetical protein